MSTETAVEDFIEVIINYQMALRVIRELIDEGPGSPAAIAERMTDKNEDGYYFSMESVDNAIGLLDTWQLLSFPEDLESDIVELWS